MRISDWSSDVCSSDLKIKLQQEAYADTLIVRARGLLGDGWETIKQTALDDQLGVIKKTLADFNVGYDQWSSEAALVESGFVQTALQRLADKGLTYEKDGALWMRTDRKSTRLNSSH